MTDRTFRLCKNPPAAYIGSRPIRLIRYSDKVESEVAFPLTALVGVKASEYPKLLISDVSVRGSLSIPSARRYQIYRAQDDAHFDLFFGDAEGIWRGSLATGAVYREMAKLLKCNQYRNHFHIEFDDGALFIWFDIPDSDDLLFPLISSKLSLIKQFIATAEERLLGFEWKKEYNENESAFTQRFVIPLLRRMGFDHVRFNHGTGEFGKDVLFSELDRFGNIRHYAAQVKTGDIKATTQGVLDVLISQIDDTFAMPVEGAGQSKRYHIAELYVIASGRITPNAVMKINQKIDSRLAGSIHFLDRSDMESLARKYWPFQ